MPSLVFLTAVLSLDVTRVLVGFGYGLGYDTDAVASGSYRFTGAASPTTNLPYPPLAISDCTGNGVPIVVTTPYPHGVSSRGIGGMACIVSGVTGNTAANNVSTDPRDRTVGLNQGVLAKPLSSTTLALYGQNASGRLVPLVGNGAWTGGGTIVPALTDGQILLGRNSIPEHSAPPRIVLVPRTIGVGPDDMSMPATRTDEGQAQTLQRALGSDAPSFDVHCWGQKLPTPDASGDYDVALAIAQAVKSSSQLLFGQASSWGSGTWDDEKERAVQLIGAGRLLTFSLSVDIPVLDTALTFAPAGISGQVTIQSNTPEVAQTLTKTIN